MPLPFDELKQNRARICLSFYLRDPQMEEPILISRQLFIVSVYN